MFWIRRRKSDDNEGALRVKKLEVASSLSDDGARIVSTSPNSRWLCIVRPNSQVCLARIESAEKEEDDAKPKILPQLAKLHRVPRQKRYEKAMYGSLGQYDRTIRCVAFSDDSRILACGDLSGCVDAWVLEKAVKNDGAMVESDASSDEEDDDESSIIIQGEQWRLANAQYPLPRTKSAILLLSFRPQQEAKHETNNGGGASEEKEKEKGLLIVLTSDHQLVEFETLTGRISNWSRRNPKTCLPAEFRGIKDRAMGAVWDKQHLRLWLYGSSWLWMFDLSCDFPSSLEQQNNPSKRKHDTEDADIVKKKKMKTNNSGAGDSIPQSQTEISLGDEIHRFVRHDDDAQAELIPLGDEPAIDDDDDDAEDEKDAADDLARLRRESDKQSATNNDRVSRRWWHTYKYRDILGIACLSSYNDPLEIAIVERPMWDVDLPGRYVREYE